MDRFWLLTWTMYGNWLLGDPRGFVSDQEFPLVLWVDAAFLKEIGEQRI
jgi:hypothetical protein